MTSTLSVAQQSLLFAAWQQWRNGVDWEDYLDHDVYALLPLIYRNLRRIRYRDSENRTYSQLASCFLTLCIVT